MMMTIRDFIYTIISSDSHVGEEDFHNIFKRSYSDEFLLRRYNEAVQTISLYSPLKEFRVVKVASSSFIPLPSDLISLYFVRANNCVLERVYPKHGSRLNQVSGYIIWGKSLELLPVPKEGDSVGLFGGYMYPQAQQLSHPFSFPDAYGPSFRMLFLFYMALTLETESATIGRWNPIPSSSSHKDYEQKTLYERYWELFIRQVNNLHERFTL